MISIPGQHLDLDVCIAGRCVFLFGNPAAKIDYSCEAEWATRTLSASRIPEDCPTRRRMTVQAIPDNKAHKTYRECKRICPGCGEPIDQRHATATIGGHLKVICPNLITGAAT